MGLTCLLGHDFGEREVERDRREAGDEVVVVYRTVENCRRCGTRRVVSENKEVRSIRDAAAAAASGSASGATAESPSESEEVTGADDGHDDAGDRGPAPAADESPAAPAGSLIEAAEAVGARDGGGTAESTTAGADASDDDAVILGGPGDDSDGSETAVDTEPPDSSVPPEPADPTAPAAPDATGASDPGESTTDATDTEAMAGSGAELIGDDAEGDGHGAWPTPAPDAEDDGYDATPHEDADSGVDFDGGLAPTDDAHAAYVGTEDDDDGGDGFVRAEQDETDVDGPTEFHCPNCGTAQEAADSSLRAGDVCPDCRKGYVAERPLER